MKTKFFVLLIAVCASVGAPALLAQNQIGGDIDGEAAHDHAGYSISLSSDGLRVAIGASGNDANGNSAGNVRVFEWNGTQWSQVGGNIDGEAANDGSGRGVSLSPDGLRVAVGGYMNDAGGSISEAGHVRVFEWDGIQWAQMGSDIDGKRPVDWTGLGESISLIGNRVAVGSPGLGNQGQISYVRVFEWNTAEWLQVGDDIEGEATGDRSGESVSLSSDGNRLAIGAGDNNGNGSYSGHVRVYEWNGMEWTQMGQDIDGEVAGDGSGESVSLSSDGNRVAIGASFNDGNGNDAGHVRVYEWNGGGWTQVGNDIDGKGPEVRSGRSVSISSNGNIVAVGGCTSSVVNFNPGYVWVYKWNGTDWIPFGDEIQGEGAIDWSGQSVSISSDGQTLAIGAHLNDGNGTDAGHVRVFDLSNITSAIQDWKDDIAIFPNPTTGKITLTGIQSSATLTIIDNLGQVVRQVNYPDQDLDVSELAAGMYHLQIQTKKGSLHRRMIKW